MILENMNLIKIIKNHMNKATVHHQVQVQNLLITIVARYLLQQKDVEILLTLSSKLAKN